MMFLSANFNFTSLLLANALRVVNFPLERRRAEPPSFFILLRSLFSPFGIALTHTWHKFLAPQRCKSLAEEGTHEVEQANVVIGHASKRIPEMPKKPCPIGCVNHALAAMGFTQPGTNLFGPLYNY